MAVDKKIGAYICKGCGLGEGLEGAQLKMIAEKEAKANIVKEHDFLCSRRHRRRRKTLPGVQRVPLPPLRHLHGRLPGAGNLI